MAKYTTEEVHTVVDGLLEDESPQLGMLIVAGMEVSEDRVEINARIRSKGMPRRAQLEILKQGFNLGFIDIVRLFFIKGKN